MSIILSNEDFLKNVLWQWSVLWGKYFALMACHLSYYLEGGNTRKWWHCQQSHRLAERDLHQSWTKTTSQPGTLKTIVIISGICSLCKILTNRFCLCGAKIQLSGVFMVQFSFKETQPVWHFPLRCICYNILIDVVFIYLFYYFNNFLTS